MVSDVLKLEMDDHPSREQLMALCDAINGGRPTVLHTGVLLAITQMALSSLDAVDIMTSIATRKRTKALAEQAAAWVRKAAPQAPCTANASGDGPECASHKEGATPATRNGPPGKSTDDSGLPAQPDGAPLSRDHRVCADRLAAASEKMVGSFRDHLGRCRACDINWQTLRDALGQWESVTK